MIRAALAATLLGVLALAPGAAASRMPGIDVSRFQGEIEWPPRRRRGDQLRLPPGEPRLGRGLQREAGAAAGPTGPTPPTTPQAKATGVRVGPYHRAFVGGRNRDGVKADAKAEARVFIERVGNLEAGDLRPALDMETPFSDLKPLELRVWARTWLRAVKDAFGVKPIIYTNVTSWAALDDPASFAHKGYPLWVANWHVPKPQVPASDWDGESWRIWQHASDGRVDGIEGHVDLDTLRGGWRGVTVAPLGRRDLPGLAGRPLSSPWRSRRPSPRPGSRPPSRGPGASRFGSSARSAFADSSAVGRCQVAMYGSGKRQFAFAEVATPPRVE